MPQLFARAKQFTQDPWAGWTIRTAFASGCPHYMFSRYVWAFRKYHCLTPKQTAELLNIIWPYIKFGLSPTIGNPQAEPPQFAPVLGGPRR